MSEKKPISCKPRKIWENAREIVGKSQIDLLGYFKVVLEQCFTSNGVKQNVRQSGKMSNKKKRKPSGYNLFIGDCMKKGDSMGECAAKWKQADKSKWNEKAKL
jgi:hypothetical protein